MKGRAHAATQRFELAVMAAWHTEYFARQTKLKNVREYLARSEDDGSAPAVEPDIILDAMLTMQASGVAMEIKKVG
jgi:hypothetical protein